MTRTIPARKWKPGADAATWLGEIPVGEAALGFAFSLTAAPIELRV
jgi:hypothetical protein